MLNYISYSKELIIYWNPKISDSISYSIYLDGKRIGECEKTFFHIFNLSPNSSYDIEIKEILKNGVESSLYKNTCRTSILKKEIRIDKPPYNAIGDNKTINTLSIQQAINDCDKCHVVVIPKGIFLTGALRLYSDTEVYIEKDGVLKGSENSNDYLPLVNSRFEGWELKCFSSLINIGYLEHTSGITTQNIKIHGEGKLIGGGEELLFNSIGINGNSINEKRNNLLTYQENLSSDKEKNYRKRGRLISINNAKDVVIEGLELSNSPSWNVHAIYSSDITICNTKITSNGIWNGDGIDPDSSKNIYIFNNVFDTGDDSIAIKSGKNPEGNIINIPSENINIFSCSILKGKSHGVSIGSEVSGGIKNINIWDSDFSHSFFGLHIKTTKKRGGYIENINVFNTKTSRILIREVSYNDDGLNDKNLTNISNIVFNNIYIEYNSGDPNFNKEVDSYVYINGFKDNRDKLNNIKLNNIHINNKEDMKEYHIENCSKVFIDEVEV